VICQRTGVVYTNLILHWGSNCSINKLRWPIHDGFNKRLSSEVLTKFELWAQRSAAQYD